MLVVGELLKDLPPEDRITPIVGMLTGVVEKGGELRVEVPDTNDAKELTKFCRKFTVPLRASLCEAGILLNMRARSAPWCTFSLSRRAPATSATPSSATTRRSIWAFRA
ncbi:hypothetical protein [Candidatus Pantoea persica]|uniref:hypothetical protein n=1 Tax=Candidatus Pantoea persica TaxID=2518128 RepID=UPI0035A93B06